jgi:hypothetical protein
MLTIFFLLTMIFQHNRLLPAIQFNIQILDGQGQSAN